ncbi:putative glucose-methanol-choline oxidoreductase [Hypoxylon trugodes]|uniref:putative glucose-methanol-choline oxidoreductase n=1 Tax=Hypoxylon trugodes TaxID=326681 RepID=UPI002199B1FF|nr:putative glucose-methanol-choline oxidoreductase [Hypoxylon trugodes]KAI1385849.1 putative glucose-methanol-choline oxidoreductase [Hypoxylon trugodes]
MSSAEFDFVIVGGGTAGLVVASRLSEDPTQRILVLEAGSDYSGDPRVRTPGFYPILSGSELDWAFESKAQPTLNGRSVKLPQGKAVGGSSAINAHVFVPPAKSVIDAWGTLGNDGWNWESLKKYYEKAYTSPYVERDLYKQLGIDGWYPDGDLSTGPIQASFSGNPAHPVRKAWEDTFKTAGYEVQHDPFHGVEVGAFSCLSSINPATKERSYAASDYYRLSRDRDNLHVLTDAVVEKILFGQGGESKSATGVRYKHDGKSKEVLCSKEVIIAAGALQSPKVLELSGIGDAELLRTHGIELIQHLPAVGENLHDHPQCAISFEAIDGVDTLDALLRQDQEAIGEAMQEYASNKTGLLTSVGVYSYAYLPAIRSFNQGGGEALKKLLDQHRPAQARDQAYHEVAERTLLDEKQPSGAYLSVLAQHILPVEPNSDSPAGPVPGKFISIDLMLSQPLSRGSAHIQSADNSIPPVIDPGYLSNPIDLEIMAQHMQHIETIANSSPFTNLLKQPLAYRDPASRLTDREAAKRYLKSSAISMWHLVGSCAMLPKEKGGVVDNELKVYGVKKLRIVDSSAIPLISTANVQSTVYAFAEKAADLIKKDYGLK